MEQVSLKEIFADESFNLRRHYSGISELAKSIEDGGLMTPLTIAPFGEVIAKPEGVNGAKFLLVSGYRRFRALSLLAEKDKKFAEHIPVMVRDVATIEDVYLSNLAENTGREQVRTCDLAKRLSELKDKGYNTPMICTRTALSKAHVNNLIRAWVSLSPIIITAWCHPSAKLEIPAMKLFYWAKFDHAKQEELFAAWASQSDEDEGEEGKSSEGSGGGERETAARPSKAELFKKLDTLRERDDVDKEPYCSYVKALRWVLGEIKKL